LVWAGYRRAGAARAPTARPKQPDDNVEVVAGPAAAGATMDEVRACLGEPASTLGWWPIEDWLYKDELVIEFRHGIVEPPSKQ
jgi:hypothetical protein